eukprot:521739_1
MNYINPSMSTAKYLFLLGMFIALSIYIIIYETFELSDDIMNQFSRNPPVISFSCNNPIHFIWNDKDKHINYLIQRPLMSYGFTINCSKESRLTVTKQQYCLKYNASLYYDAFCNGGMFYSPWKKRNRKLTFMDYQLEDMFIKTKMNQMLTLYCSNQPNETVCDFNLLGYDMEDINQRTEFLKKHLNLDVENNITWVFKEYNKHGGSGIHFYSNQTLIYALLAPDAPDALPLKHSYLKQEGFSRCGEKKQKTICFENLLIQEFISNPLLIEDHAFHIRANFLIPSFSNPFIVLYYPQGQIFRNPGKYTKKHLNKHVLMSNFHAGINNLVAESDFKMCWGYHRFQVYLDDTFGAKLNNYTQNKLQKDIKQIAKHLFAANAYNNKLKNEEKFRQKRKVLRHEFITFCVDMIITDAFELKFLEINHGCGLFSLYHDEWKHYIDNAGRDLMSAEYADETADILLEVQKKRHYDVPITNLDSLNNLDLVYWENK